jgi:pimeloyl-ACP methyl ester carboxylesterase
VALLGSLGLATAHVVGASMGGMIAQMLAARHPERVRSLVSMMSTTGEPGIAPPSPEAAAMLAGPRPQTADEAADRTVEGSRIWGSRDLLDEDAIRDHARAAFERAVNPAGFARQLAAIYASGDRTELLRSVTAPTLVIHGLIDTLVPSAGGRATAAAIPGAELMLVEGMGHDLPRALWPRLVDAIAGHVERAERVARAA